MSGGGWWYCAVADDFHIGGSSGDCSVAVVVVALSDLSKPRSRAKAGFGGVICRLGGRSLGCTPVGDPCAYVGQRVPERTGLLL